MNARQYEKLIKALKQTNLIKELSPNIETHYYLFKREL